MSHQHELISESQQILNEVLEVMSQYRDEVDGTGRRWPKSVRTRVVRLVELGVPKRRISQETKIPKATVYAWFRKSRGKGGFVQVPATRPCPAARPVSLAAGKNPVARQTEVTPVAESEIRVSLADGTQVSGLSLAQLIAFCRERSR